MTNSTIVGYGTPVFKKEEEDLTKAETQALIDNAVKPLQTQLAAANTELAMLQKTYAYLEDVPEWYRDAVRFYVDKNILKGKGTKNRTPFLDLTDAA